MKITSLMELENEKVSHNPEIKKKTLLKANDLPYLTNYSQACIAPGQISKEHFHNDMYEIFFVIDGMGIIRVNGEEFHLGEGVCVAVEPGENHEIINSSKSDLVLNYFGLES